MKILSALKKIAGILNSTEVSWILAGSTASYLNGLDVEPRDIDILTDQFGAYIIDREFASKRIKAIKRVGFSETDTYASHFGIFLINDTQVEIIGDLVIKYKGYLIKVDMLGLISNAVEKKIDDSLFLIVPLEWQLVINSIIPGKEDRAEEIAKHLKQKGINYNLIENFLTTMPEVVRERVNELLSSY